MDPGFKSKIVYNLQQALDDHGRYVKDGCSLWDYHEVGEAEKEVQNSGQDQYHHNHLEDIRMQQNEDSQNGAYEFVSSFVSPQTVGNVYLYLAWGSGGRLKSG